MSFACFFINVDNESQRMRVTDKDAVKTLHDGLSHVSTQWHLEADKMLIAVSCHSDKVDDTLLQQRNDTLYQSPMKTFGGWVRVKFINSDPKINKINKIAVLINPHDSIFNKTQLLHKNVRILVYIPKCFPFF